VLIKPRARTLCTSRKIGCLAIIFFIVVTSKISGVGLFVWLPAATSRPENSE
jgi:hypothetical protein